MNFFEIFRRELVVSRTGNGSYNENGIWNNGELETFNIKASIQQIEPEILETLPEGYRTRETYSLITETELKTAIAGVTNADYVTIDDQKFQVVKVARWNNLNYSTDHFEALVVRVNVDL